MADGKMRKMGTSMIRFCQGQSGRFASHWVFLRFLGRVLLVRSEDRAPQECDPSAAGWIYSGAGRRAPLSLCHWNPVKAINSSALFAWLPLG
jgi:hypothetical protein